MLGKSTKGFAEENGMVPQYSWPGGAPILYGVQDSRDRWAHEEWVCAFCANRMPKGSILSWDVHEEGPLHECDRCGFLLPSLYGDPDLSEQENEQEDFRAMSEEITLLVSRLSRFPAEAPEDHPSLRQRRRRITSLILSLLNRLRHDAGPGSLAFTRPARYAIDQGFAPWEVFGTPEPAFF